ncbi:hypothetical protein JOQ06_026967, partial [Pogonophryne albipinna]
ALHSRVTDQAQKTLSEGDSRKSLKPGDYKKMDLLIHIYLLQSSFLKDYATVSQHELTLWLGVCCQQPALLKARSDNLAPMTRLATAQFTG